MSFLFPAFLAGLALIGVPVLLHLARRRTGRQVPFSSLMFLTQTPPRFERRKRIEHWLLLALRAAAVALLAAAFARPFLTKPPPALAAAAGARIVVLLDTSASMRREGLWEQALDRVRAVAGRAAPGDRVAVLAFDRAPRTVMGFEQWSALPPGQRAAAVASRLGALEPGWASTDIGRALVAATDALADDAEGTPGAGRKVVIVSDMQEGARLDAVASAGWPPGVALALERVDARAPTNAAAHATAAPRDGKARVRVVNARGSTGELFAVRWEGAGEPAAVELPPGGARVVELAAPGSAGAVVLSGDDHAFDNRLYIAGPVAAVVKVLYVGTDGGDDAQGPLYYLRRAFPETALRRAEIVARSPDDARVAADAAGAHLIVVTAPLPPAALGAARGHLARGRTVLVTAGSVEAARAAGELAGVALPATEGAAAPSSYALLSELDFTHPILAPLAEPRFADFTKIRFWKRRKLDLAAVRGARVIARFDDGTPAWVTLPAQRGTVLVFAAGWHPADGQLALSSKFVPVLHAVLETSAGLSSGQAQFFVGDPVPLPAGGKREVRRPDGRTVAVGATAAVFGETDVPGLYELTVDQDRRTFAVNLAPAESATAPLGPEALERLGVFAGADAAQAAAPVAQAQSWRARVEGEQKAWRWLLAAALLILVVETFLAGRVGRRRVAKEAA